MSKLLMRATLSHHPKIKMLQYFGYLLRFQNREIAAHNLHCDQLSTDEMRFWLATWRLLKY